MSATRERFEKWCESKALPAVRRDNGDYDSGFTRKYWDCWQSAADMDELLGALRDFLDHDGGEGSKDYDAQKYRQNRERLRVLARYGKS